MQKHLQNRPPDTTLRSMRILMVDDQEVNVILLDHILQAAGYTNLISTTDPTQVVPLFLSMQPDLILLDLRMPRMDGFEVMERLKPLIPPDAFMPILVLTADATSETKHRALSLLASDYLNKPLDATEVTLRISNLLKTRSLYLQNVAYSHSLESMVDERTAELEEARLEILDRLGHAAEYRDDTTGRHTYRVGHLCAEIALALGLSAGAVDLIRHASPLHDLGKIGIPDSVLLKPGPLTAEEFELMKTHTTIGASILAEGKSELVKVARSIALTHHERWNGKGYPQGLAGEDIPIEGRIVAVADVFDALIHDRPYKKAWTIEEALKEIRGQGGQHFDPVVLEAFLSVDFAGLHARLDG